MRHRKKTAHETHETHNLFTPSARLSFLLCIVTPQATQMTGPPVPAAWRDKGGPGTVAAVLNLTAPRLGELTDAQAGALRKALLATLASDVPGLDVKRVKQQGTAAPVVEQGGAGAADRMRVGVDLVAPQARLSDLLRRMQAVSDNAELAGALRASGLYDLTDARFDSYELRAGGRSAAGGGEKDGDTDKAGAQREGGGAVIELPPLPPLPKPIAVPPTAPAQPATPPQPQPSPAPPPSPSGKGQAPITAGIEVAGTFPSSSDLTPERRAALARAVAVLAGVPEGQVSVVEEAGRRRALLQQGAAAAAAPWARRFEVQVTPADAGQAAAARAALTRLATPAGAADLRAALASQGWDGLAAAGLTGLNGKKVNGAGTGAAPVLKPAAAANEAGGGGESKSGGGKLAGKLAGIIIGCLVGATLLALAAAYALAYFLGWCRCLGVGVKGAGGGDEEKAGGGVGWRAKAKARAAGGGAPSAAVASAYKLTEGEEERAADLKAAAAAAAAGNKADADGAAVAAAAAAVADDARRDLASIAAAGVTSLRRLASGAKDRTGRPGSAGVGVGGAAGAATSTRAGATTTPVSGDAAATADAVMDFVRKGAPLAGTFALERGALVPGQAAVTVKARQVGGAARAAVATFYVDDDAHARAVGLGGRLPDGSATPAVLAAYGRGDAPGAPGLPPVIVREAPDYALDAWVAKRFRCVCSSIKRRKSRTGRLSTPCPSLFPSISLSFRSLSLTLSPSPSLKQDPGPHAAQGRPVPGDQARRRLCGQGPGPRRAFTRHRPLVCGRQRDEAGGRGRVGAQGRPRCGPPPRARLCGAGGAVSAVPGGGDRRARPNHRGHARPGRLVPGHAGLPGPDGRAPDPGGCVRERRGGRHRHGRPPALGTRGRGAGGAGGPGRGRGHQGPAPEGAQEADNRGGIAGWPPVQRPGRRGGGGRHDGHAPAGEMRKCGDGGCGFVWVVCVCVCVCVCV